MRKVYFIYDDLREEITSSFIRKNTKAAIHDTEEAFKREGRDGTHITLYRVVTLFDDNDITEEEHKNLKDIEGLPCLLCWDSDCISWEKLEDDGSK